MTASLFPPEQVLDNTGIAWLYPSSSENKAAGRTIIVLGAPRGGTSMVAGVLAQLQVDMGGDAPVYEDRRLLDLLTGTVQKSLQGYIERKNCQYPRWGWKLPQAIKLLPEHIQRFNNPYLVAVFRDPLAVASRNNLSVNYPLTDNLKLTLSYYVLLVELLKRFELPTLMLSYEKALLRPAAMVGNLARFIGLPEETQLDKAITFIKTSPIEYRQHTHTKQIAGMVTRVGNGYLLGWACYHKHPDLPVSLDIVLGDTTLSLIANRRRPWLKQRGLHPTGNCGFACKVVDPCLQRHLPAAVVRVAETGEIVPRKQPGPDPAGEPGA